MSTNTSVRLAAVFRWTARILGTLLVLFVVALAIGEGMPNPFTQPAMVQLGFFALGLQLVGILVGWRFELAGAILSLAGWVMFLPLVIHSPRGINPFVLTMALPGAFYLISALMRICHKTKTLA